MEQIWTTSIGKQQGIDLLNAHAQWYCNDIEPVTTYPFQNWADTANNLWKQRNENNDGWIVRGVLNAIQFGLTPIDGWTSGLTAVYVSSNEIKIEDLDVTDRIQQGTKIRYKQGGEYKYDFVSEVSFATDSTLTLMGGSTVEEEAITDFAYSNIANPIGWPFGVDYIEGENANGVWKMWADGDLEAEGTFQIAIDIASKTGELFRSDPFNIPLPYEFHSVISVQYSLIHQSDLGMHMIGIGTPGGATMTQIENLVVYRTVSGTGGTFKIGFRVKGRWKE